MTFSRTRPTLASLQPGDRACLIYQIEDERRRVVADYLRHGLEQGQRVLYLTAGRDPAEVLHGLAPAGLAAEPYLASGQLVVQDAAAAGLVSSDTPETLLDWIRSWTARSAAQGFASVRVTGEFWALLDRLANISDMLAFEDGLDRLGAESAMLSLCQYDRSRVEPGLLLVVLRSHPLAIVGGQLVANPFYLPPAEYQKPVEQADRLQFWLDEMGRQHEIATALERRFAIGQTLTSIADRLQQTADLNAAIQAALHDLADLTGANRASLYRLRDGGSRLDNTHEWCAPGVTPRVELRQNLSTGRFPWLLRAFDRTEVLYLPELGALPPDATGDRELLLDRQVRSLLALPLRFGTRLAGVVGLENPDAVRDWPEQDLALLLMAGEMLSGALGRRRAEQEARRRASQLVALQEVGLALADEQDEERLLQAIVQQAVELAQATGGGFYRHDPERDCLLRSVSISDNPLPLGTVRRRGEGLSGRVWLQNKPLAVDNYATWEGRAGVLRPETPAGALGVPVRWGDSLLGVLTVSARPGARPPFGPRDIELLELLATQAAIAIRNSQLLAQTGRRAEQLAVVNRIGRAASGQLELDELLATVYREIDSVFSLDSFFIALLDAPAGELEFRLMMDGGEQLPAERHPLGFGLASQVAQTGEPLRVADLHQEPALQARTATRGSEGLPRSWLGVPMRTADELLGVISMQSSQPSLYDQDDQQLLDTIADQVAAAVRSARLHQQTRRQAERLAAVVRVSQALGASLELPTISQLAHRAIQELVDCPHFALIGYDDSRQELCPLYIIGDHQPVDLSGIRPVPLDPAAGPNSQAILTRRPVIVGDLQNRRGQLQDYHSIETGDDRQVQSVLSVPLIVGEQVLGVLQIQSYGMDAYDADDGELLASIAHQLALAVKNAQLFSAEHESRLQAEALNVIMTVAAGAEDLGALMEAVLDQSLLATDLTMGAIWISGEYRMRGLPADVGAISRPMAQATGLIGTETSTIEDWQTVPPEHPAGPVAESILRSGVRASLIVPVMAAGRRVGGIGLASRQPRGWSEREIALIAAVGRNLGATVQRLRLLEQVRAEAQRLQATIDSVPEGVLLLDAERRVLLANPLAESYLDRLAESWRQVPLGALAGRPLAELLAPPAEGLWHELALSDGNREYIFELAARPLGAVGQEAGCVLVLRDVSQEREIQERVQQQDRLAAVGQLAAGIAHDFNNIMAVIVLYAQLTRQQVDLPAAAHERMQVVDQQAKSASQLIAQILDFSRSAVLERRPFNLVGFLNEQIKLLQRTLPENIAVEFEAGRPEYIINADPTRIQQVVTNLAINARDAMPAGGRLAFELSGFDLEPGAPPPLPSLAPGRWVCLTVSDSGHGIPPETLAHIFDPFFTTKERGKGSGLGLAQVHGIVKQHDGEIEAESEVGHGATFRIFLPDARVEAAPELADPAPLRLGHGESVLVVEDDPVVRLALVGSLEALNYQPIEARNGVEALDIYMQRGSEIAAVISDLVMPEMGGRELFIALRRDNPQLRMALLTGHPLQTELVDLAGQGLVGSMLKPVRLEALGELMARVLADQDQTG